MNEENKEEITDSEVAETEEAASAEGRKSSRKPMYITLAVTGLIVLGVIALWLIQSGERERPMPAPRTVGFGQDETQTAALPEDQTLTIEPEQIENIKLETEAVGETFSAEIAGATATGVVQANAYGETPVISLVGGVVREARAQLGKYVQRGETLVVIYSDQLAQTESNYLAMVAETEEARKRYERAQNLTGIAQEARTEVDRAIAELKISEAELVENRSNFERTEKLVRIGASSRQDLEQSTTRLKTSQAKVEEAKKRLERANRLLQINPERRAELDAALSQLRSTEAKADAERQRLLVLGLSPARINQLRNTRRVSSELPITSPVSGTVTARAVNPNEIVEANKELMRVTNLSTVWVIAEVYERDLGRIRTGSGASVTSDAFPGKVFRGQVTYIDPNLNQATRTAQVRVEVENPGQVFKIGMYVNVAFGALGMAEQTAAVVPSAAVQTINNQTAVFLTTEKPNVFLLRPVRLGAETEGRYVVLEGLTVGDRVVTTGSFLLRAEWLKQKTGF
jgi:RND family efflux transporter MFP subunit